MSIKVRLLSGGVWVLIGRLSALTLAFFINVLLARLIDAEDLGIYFLAVSLVNILSVFGLFGMNRLVVRLIAERLSSPYHSSIKVILRKSFVISGIGLLIVAAVYWFSLRNWLGEIILHVDHVEGFSVYIVIWLLLWGGQTFVAEALRGFHDIRGATIFGGLLYNLIFALGLIIIWLMSEEVNLQSIFMVLNGALLVNLMLALMSLRSRHENINPSTETVSDDHILRSGLYFMLTSISLLLINDVHLWIVGYFHESGQVAEYGASFRLVNILILPLTMINMLIASSVAQLYSEKNIQKLRWLMATSAAIAGVPTILALIVALGWGEGLLGVVYGEQYTTAFSVLMVLAIAHIFNAAVGSPGVLLMMTGNEKHVMLFSVGSAVCGIALSLLLTPKYGAMGAACGTALTVALHNLSMWVYSTRVLEVNTRLKVASLLDIYQRIRVEIEVKANDSKHMEYLERIIREIETFLWKLQGIKIVDCFGDSHARIFRLLNGHKLLQGHRFRAISVRGATIFGLGNPNSKTNSLYIFNAWLRKMPGNRPIVFMLGEVDMGFLIWWRAKRHGIDPSEAFNEAIRRYQEYLQKVMETHKHIIIVSAPLPTIPDSFTGGEVAGARAEVNVSQVERTGATLRFNLIMKGWCGDMNISFIDMDRLSLDVETKVVRSTLLNDDPGDHHYNQRAFVNVLAESLVYADVL